MKIGLSFSRCVKDIVDGTVDINDVLIIISRTDFDPNVDEEWTGIWQGYGGGTDPTVSSHGHFGIFSHSEPEWAAYGPEDEDKFRAVSLQLWNDGKLHQPRRFGSYPIRRAEYWLETCLPNSELERNPAAKKAWEHFQMVAELTNVKIDKDYS